MFKIMRYPLNKGRDAAEEYDTFDCSQSQATDLVVVLRGMRDGHWYWPEKVVMEPTVENAEELHAIEVKSSVMALFA